jgi:hypothetical protein
MRARLERATGLYPKRGLGIWWEYGCLGTTYGQEGRNYFLSISVLVWREFELQVSWTR